MNTVHEHLLTNHSSVPKDRVEAVIAKSTPPVDAAAGSKRIKSSFADDSRIMEIVPQFVAELSPKVRMLIDLLEQNDLPALQGVAHQLLGTCGGYGFDAVSRPARRVEQSIQTDEDLDSITSGVQSLIAVIRRIDGYDESKELVVAAAL